MRLVVPGVHARSHPRWPIWLITPALVVALVLTACPQITAMTSDGAPALRPYLPDTAERPPLSQARQGGTATALESLPTEPEQAPAAGSADHAAYLPTLLGNHCEVAESPFGVQVTYLYPALVDKICQGGASWIRMPLYWSSIEPQNTTPENYQWNEYQDRQLAAASARGIRLILTLMYNPAWAATYAGGPIDLVDIGELVEFMTAAVARYSGPPYYVKHWEFYNEPDNTCLAHATHGGWGYFGNEPEAYAQILAAVYGPMKALDPEAQILFGGLAHDRFTTDDPPGCFARDFVDRVLEAGGGDHFDVMNFHYYPGFAGVWAPYGAGIAGKATALRARLAEHDVSKPLVCTETSMWSDEMHGGSDELQSRYIAQVYVRSVTAGLETTVWFLLLDIDDPLGWKTGLMTNDAVPKPAYSAYQTAAGQLSSARYLRAVPPAETGSDQIEAYEFEAGDGGPRLVVAWTKDEAPRTLVLATEQVVRTGKYGQAALLGDGDDGIVDGRVAAVIDPSPVYLRFLPPAGRGPSGEQ